MPVSKYNGLDIEQWKERAERAAAMVRELWEQCEYLVWPDEMDARVAEILAQIEKE